MINERISCAVRTKLGRSWDKMEKEVVPSRYFTTTNRRMVYKYLLGRDVAAYQHFLVSGDIFHFFFLFFFYYYFWKISTR